MNICFYADHPYWGQLSPNGGTATILRSVMTLREMGHAANVVAHKDTFKWFVHPKPIQHIPKDSDVCIAVSSNDIKPMLDDMPKTARPFYWARLLDNKKMPKADLLRYASKVTTLVNSENLRDWFKKYGVETKIAYQGVDIDSWHNEFNRIEKRTIGFLVSNKKRKHFEVVEKIVKQLGSKYDYVGYGAAKDQDRHTKGFSSRNFIYFKSDIRHPGLVSLYNMAHTWVVTSTKEGLHNPPIEAALCGCAVVYPDSYLAGCSDHCIDGETAWEYKALNIESACKAIQEANTSRNDAHIAVIKEKIGTRVVAMARLVRILESSLGGKNANN